MSRALEGEEEDVIQMSLWNCSTKCLLLNNDVSFGTFTFIFLFSRFRPHLGKPQSEEKNLFIKKFHKTVTPPLPPSGFYESLYVFAAILLISVYKKIGAWNRVAPLPLRNFSTFFPNEGFPNQGCINCAILPSGMVARVEHGDVFLFSNLGVLWFSENLIRYSLHVCLREVKNNLFSFKHSYLRHFSWRF